MAESSEDVSGDGMPDNPEDDEVKAELIEAVKLHSILYNPASNSNRNKFLRENAWIAVGVLVNRGDLWCKNEFKKLRDNYLKKKKAIIGKTGQARKKIEAWTHFTSMQFLDDYAVTARISGNLLADSDDESNIPDSAPEVGPSDCTPQRSLPKQARQIEKSQADPTYSSKRNRQKELDPVDQEFISFLKKPKQAEDSHHHFGMSLAE